MEVEITCPSGLRGVLRSLKVKDEALYADKKLVRGGGLIQALLERCWVKTLDLGPYTLPGNGSGDVAFSWAKALQGDAFYAFLQLRAVSYGDDYEFTLTCPKCDRESTHALKLSALIVKALPEASKAKISSGQPFETVVSGKRFSHRLLTLEDDRAISMLRENRNMPPRTAALVRRIVSIEGIQNHPSHIIKFVEDLDSSEAVELEVAMEAFDCGVETLIDGDCRHCFSQFKEIIPFGVSFFVPRRRKTTKPIEGFEVT